MRIEPYSHWLLVAQQRLAEDLSVAERYGAPPPAEAALPSAAAAHDRAAHAGARGAQARGEAAQPNRGRPMMRAVPQHGRAAGKGRGGIVDLQA